MKWRSDRQDSAAVTFPCLPSPSERSWFRNGQPVVVGRYVCMYEYLCGFNTCAGRV